MVSFGNLRTTGKIRFSLLCLMFGIIGLSGLSAQGPEGAPPEGGGRGGRGRRNFDPGQMIRGMDQDNNGVITANEVERVPGFIRDRWTQQGHDFSRGVSVNDLVQSAQRGMEEGRRNREERGFGAGGEFNRSNGQYGEPQFQPGQSFFPPPPPGTMPVPGSISPAPNTSPPGPPVPGATPAPGTTPGSPARSNRPRVSPLIPDAYKPIDLNSDGQVALSEWKSSKRGPLAQFKQFDLDQDGFLTPKELTRAPLTTPVMAGQPGSTSPSTGSNATVTPSTSPMPAVPPASPPAAVAVSAETAAKAGRAFDLLDKDKSGTVVGPEWNESSRLRPLFEKGGYNLSQPMSKSDFTQAYARVGA